MNGEFTKALNSEKDQEIRHGGANSSNPIRDLAPARQPLALVVAYKLLTGWISMRGLFDDEMTGEVSPGRGRRLVPWVMAAGGSPFVVARQLYGAWLLPMSAGRSWRTGGEG